MTNFAFLPDPFSAIAQSATPAEGYINSGKRGKKWVRAIAKSYSVKLQAYPTP